MTNQELRQALETIRTRFSTEGRRPGHFLTAAEASVDELAAVATALLDRVELLEKSVRDLAETNLVLIAHIVELQEDRRKGR